MSERNRIYRYKYSTWKSVRPGNKLSTDLHQWFYMIAKGGSVVRLDFC